MAPFVFLGLRFFGPSMCSKDPRRGIVSSQSADPSDPQGHPPGLIARQFGADVSKAT